MSHYYSKDSDLQASHPKLIRFKINDAEYTMETDQGVFSKTGLDYGTRVLLETILPLQCKSVLDLGCGYGPIGIVLKKETSADVTMVDINPRAVKLAKENALRNHLAIQAIESDGFSKIESTFDAIVSNPPIRAGKQVFYPWFQESLSHLNENGSLFIVIQKKQGAPSAIKECEKHFSLVEVLEKKSGYYVIKCQK